MRGSVPFILFYYAVLPCKFLDSWVSLGSLRSESPRSFSFLQVPLGADLFGSLVKNRGGEWTGKWWCPWDGEGRFL